MNTQNAHLARKFIRELEEFLNAQLGDGAAAASQAADALPDLFASQAAGERTESGFVQQCY